MGCWAEESMGGRERGEKNQEESPKHMMPVNYHKNVRLLRCTYVLLAGGSKRGEIAACQASCEG